MQQAKTRAVKVRLCLVYKYFRMHLTGQRKRLTLSCANVIQAFQLTDLLHIGGL